jgi:hypothetical protein
VQSRNVAQVAYEPDVLVLAIRYRDGHLYIRPGVTPEQFAALLAAESVGRYLAGMREPAIQIKKEDAQRETQSKVATISGDDPVTVPATPPAAPEVLNVLDPDASACCKRSGPTLWRGEPDAIVCASCGTTFKPDPDVPSVRFWRIVPSFATLRLRRG